VDNTQCHSTLRRPYLIQYVAVTDLDLSGQFRLQYQVPLRLTEVGLRSIVLDIMFIGNLQRAILETLNYSDIFEYPLRLEELHRYLTLHTHVEQLANVLDSLIGQVGRQDDFYFIAGHGEIVETRKQRQRRAEKLFPIAWRYGRVLGQLPFVRMVALTGSLAVMNVSERADFDYLLVTEPGRLWTARAFAVLFGRMMRLSGHRICVNVLVSENALSWPQHDLYSAREICQMIPITGMDLYHRLRQANAWTKSFLPNCSLSLPTVVQLPEQHESNQIQHILEAPLRGRRGQGLEQWAMRFQLRRIQGRPGASDETNFSADVCQANFHQHRRSVGEAFQQRLKELNDHSFATPVLKEALIRQGANTTGRAKVGEK